MGTSCCKEVRVDTNNKTRIIADGEQNISWIKGDKIGSGAFGTVFLALDTETAGMLAVKSISLTKNKENSTKFMENIRKEIKILKSLNHPNIIKYFQTDIDIDNNELNIITEYASGGSLISVVRQFKSLPERVIQRFTKQILSALVYLHSKNIIHRDLKCANILLTQNSHIKLTDFGLSKFISAGCKSLEIAGSPYWMAPEVLTNEGTDSSADIWSLGCLLIEMMTGYPPWYNISKSTKEVLKIIALPMSVPEIPQCSKELKNFLTLCLNRNQDERPTAEQLINHDFIVNESNSAGMTTLLSDSCVD